MGHVSAVDLERLRPVLAGDAVTALGPFPVVLGRTEDQFVVLQHDRRTVRLRWRGEGPLTLSRANELLHEQQRTSSSGVTSLGSGFVASPTTPTARRPSSGPGALVGTAAGDDNDDEDDEDTVRPRHPASALSRIRLVSTVERSLAMCTCHAWCGRQDESLLQRTLDRLVRPLTRVTEYLLWTFDDDPPIPAAKKLYVDKIIYRLVKSHRVPLTRRESAIANHARCACAPAHVVQWTFERTTPTELVAARRTCASAQDPASLVQGVVSR